jgi:FkbM family methyltransferase
MRTVVIENSFIKHECHRHGIEPSAIGASIFETYAQCSEDLIVEAVLRALARRTGRDMSKMRYIEIGANHPIQTSSTYLLYKVYGASGVLVEPIPALAEKLRAIRPNDVVVNCTVTSSTAAVAELYVHEMNELSSMSAPHIALFGMYGGVEKVTESIMCKNMHINDFMKTYGFGPIDYLSIDIEGLDIDLLLAMDPAFQPAIIQCEHEDQVEEFCQVLGGRGYGLLAMTDVNILFVRRGII